MQSKRLTKTKKAGRPPTLTMPEPIDDTIDNVMDAVLSTPPKKRGEWKYLQNKSATSQCPNGADTSDGVSNLR
jgi:hypothetical protein